MRTLTLSLATLIASLLSVPGLADNLRVGRYQYECSDDNAVSVTIFPPSNGAFRAVLQMNDYRSDATPLESEDCGGATCYSGTPSLDLQFAAFDDFWGQIESCFGRYIDVPLSNIQQFGSDTLYVVANRPYSISGCYLQRTQTEYVLTLCH